MGSEVAKRPPIAEITDELNKGAARMALLVPRAYQKGYDVGKQIATFAIEAMKNPALLECSPISVKLAFFHASSLGLEIGSALGHAYLVPFKSTCQMIPGYRGLIYAAIRSGACKQIWAETVHESDTFSHEVGTDPKIRHQPCLGERGEMIGSYAVARLHGGGTQFVVLGMEEIQKIRAVSRNSKADAPWRVWFDEMAKKSAIRRLVKQLAISTDEQRASFLKAVAVDAEIDGGASQEQVSATLGLAVTDVPRIEKAKSTDQFDKALEGSQEFDAAASAAMDKQNAEAP